MPPGGGNARWIQRAAQKRNPFFGSEMPTCGTEVDGETSAVAPKSRTGMQQLPPGHPPIPGMSSMSVVDFVRMEAAAKNAPALSATTPAAEGACGSCGMSAAAMAAGEPCEHEAHAPAAAKTPAKTDT
jgi:Cu(I)/Ag(I) efflux system membrane fusion protein